MCAAQSISANILGVGTVQFQRSVTKASVATSTAVLAQEAAIKAVSDDLKALREDFVEYQKSANDRLTKLDTPLIKPADQERADADSGQLDAKLKAVRVAREPLVKADKELRRVTKRIF